MNNRFDVSVMYPCINVSETDISAFVAGNKNAFACNDKHLLPICNIVLFRLGGRTHLVYSTYIHKIISGST